MSATDIAVQQSSLSSHLTSPVTKETQTLRDSVEKAMSNYFAHLDGQDVTEYLQHGTD